MATLLIALLFATSILLAATLLAAALLAAALLAATLLAATLLAATLTALLSLISSRRFDRPTRIFVFFHIVPFFYDIEVYELRLRAFREAVLRFFLIRNEKSGWLCKFFASDPAK